MLNPDNQTLTLHGKEWYDPTAPDYPQMNKRHVKTVIDLNRENAKVRKNQKQVEAAKVPFKMEKWSGVEAKIKAEELEHHEADFYQSAVEKGKLERE